MYIFWGARRISICNYPVLIFISYFIFSRYSFLSFRSVLSSKWKRMHHTFLWSSKRMEMWRGKPLCSAFDLRRKIWDLSWMPCTRKSARTDAVKAVLSESTVPSAGVWDVEHVCRVSLFYTFFLQPREPSFPFRRATLCLLKRERKGKKKMSELPNLVRLCGRGSHSQHSRQRQTFHMKAERD